MQNHFVIADIMVGLLTVLVIFLLATVVYICVSKGIFSLSTRVA